MPPSSSVALPAAAPPTARLAPWPLITVALGFVMAMLDVTVVNVALSHIQTSFAVPLSGLVWVVDGYTLSFASLLLIGGALANRFGARAIYMGGLGLFVFASLLCGAAPSGAALVAARLLQGVGAALFMPSSLSLLTQAYPQDHVRAKVLGLWSAIVSVAAATGPITGGLVVTTLGWRSIFWLNVPIGLLGLVLARRVLAASPRRSQAINPGGHLLGVVALGALSFALIEGANYGWGSAPILAAFVVAALAVIGFVWRERRDAAPIMPRALFRDAHFPAANGIGFLINFGAFGQLFLVSLYFQQARGADAWHTGEYLLPLMAMFTLGNLLSTRIMGRWGMRLPMLAGLGAAALVAALLTLDAALPSWLFSVLVAAINLGVAIAVPAMTTTVMRVAGQQHANIAAAALNANRQIGALIGVAAMGVVLHTHAAWTQALPLAFGLLALAYAAAAALVARYID